MARYDSFRALATRLITKNGRNVSFVDRPDQSGSVTQPWKVEAADKNEGSPVTVRAVIVPMMHMKIDGTTVKVTDKTCYLSAADVNDVEITTQDRIVDGSKTYVVKDVVDISPGEQKVLYILQLRGT